MKETKNGGESDGREEEEGEKGKKIKKEKEREIGLEFGPLK